MSTTYFPQVNASLNAAAGIMICFGYFFITRRPRAIVPHVVCMISAVVCSAAFLVSYLTYHTIKSMKGEVLTIFPPHALWRPVYLTILISHTILAAVVLPMIVLTVVRAAKKRWIEHMRIARKTFWIWLYVSVTGVIVYWMLYHLAPTIREQ